MNAHSTLRMTATRIAPGRSGPADLVRFLDAPPVSPEADRVAARALERIRREGDRAVAALTLQFTGAALSPRNFRVSAAELKSAARSVSPAFRRAARAVRARVLRFARAGLRADWSIRTPGGGRLGERFVPIQRVGLYIPGGASPLASTALMTVPLAQAAGVPEIAVCTPARADGSVDPHILHALQLCGVTEVYRLGGIQAVGALAYGTRMVPRVDLIAGPGGPYVTAAKRHVYGRVALDMVAGPSEIAVLCDGSASVEQVAADLLSQAEHGTGAERTLCVTTSASLARRLPAALAAMASAWPRWPMIRRVLEHNSRIVLVSSMEEGIRIINRFAPEHLEILAKQPRIWAARVIHAGAIFIGPWTPESAGDFVAGPSHVLPTGGSARYFSGLTAETFRRRMSVLELAESDLKAWYPAIAEFARIEGLPAHAESARRRLAARKP